MDDMDELEQMEELEAMTTPDTTPQPPLETASGDAGADALSLSPSPVAAAGSDEEQLGELDELEELEELGAESSPGESNQEPFASPCSYIVADAWFAAEQTPERAASPAVATTPPPREPSPEPAAPVEMGAVARLREQGA